jgi:hypothetical protein
MSNDLYRRTVLDYLETIKSLFELRPTDTGCLIVTPFQRPDGDYIEVELKSELDGRIIVTDNGDSANFLFASGLDVNNEEFKDTLSLIMSLHGTEIMGDEIRLATTKEKLGKALYSLLNAILAVNSLVYRKRLAKISEPTF